MTELSLSRIGQNARWAVIGAIKGAARFLSRAARPGNYRTVI